MVDTPIIPEHEKWKQENQLRIILVYTVNGYIRLYQKEKEKKIKQNNGSNYDIFIHVYNLLRSYYYPFLSSLSLGPLHFTNTPSFYFHTFCLNCEVYVSVLFCFFNLKALPWVGAQWSGRALNYHAQWSGFNSQHYKNKYRKFQIK